MAIETSLLLLVILIVIGFIVYRMVRGIWTVLLWVLIAGGVLFVVYYLL
ncbi:TPA: hypothetical protein H1008_00210 [archaeon]|jgi:hypothetical protein|uniref:Uncharacterized protein n=1 Tax=Candidatus Undinarchaeum marinum TaxID=2756141 RepID=A0A832XLA8_9ARCH|nr:hypothetical protein [Candidatus Undinarchaeum marinum]HIK01528.1 hypothetical protein [Candidatus Undinarchaeales archaeon SRR5007147.bin71]